MPISSSSGQAASTAARSFDSLAASGSVTLTSIPFARQRAAQPLPITPAPTKAMRVMFVTVGVEVIAI